MTNKTQLKKSISEAFKNDDFSIAFELLLSLPHHEVVTLVSKNKWIEKPDVSEFFWTKFCIVDFEYTFCCQAAESVLNWYLKDLGRTSDELNLLLIEQLPVLFIKAIRRNRAFLNKDFLSRITSYQWASEYSVDILAWNELYKRFVSHQTKIQESWRLIDTQPFEIILTGIIHWVDVRFYDKSFHLSHDQLQKIYNYSVNYLFAKMETKTPPSAQEFDDTFFRYVNDNKYDRVNLFLCSVKEWLAFDSTVLSSYCFDDNFRASMKVGIVHFEFESNQAYEKWLEDNERYLVNTKRYYFNSAVYIENKIESGELNFLDCETDLDEAIKYSQQINLTQSSCFLADMQLNHLWFNGKPVHCSKFLEGLVGFSVNRRAKYVDRMNEFIDQGKCWSDSLQNVFDTEGENYEKNLPYPYIYFHVKDLENIYRHAMPRMELAEIQDLIQHFSLTLKSNREVDPFYNPYSVAETPFIKLGEYVFTPTSFFATNDWFYSFAQRILYKYSSPNHIKERNGTASEMEQELGKKFKENGWNVKVISQEEANNIDGDIDLFVNDGKSQLLIQLKRTKFKLDLSSDYKDVLETDLKASGQLNEAVKMLESKPMPGMEILKNHQKWMVTTSFEGVLSRRDGCIKVNYFDLLWALRNIKFASLEDFKSYVLSDKPFTESRNYLKPLEL